MNKKRFEQLCSKVLVPRFVKAIRNELSSVDALLEVIGAELARRSAAEPNPDGSDAYEKARSRSIVFGFRR